MQYKYLAATLLASTGLSAANPVAPRQNLPETPTSLATNGNWIWRVNNLSARKLDGETINSLSFDVEGTKGTISETCTSKSIVEPGKFYPCNDKTDLQFAFQNDRSGLLLYKDWNGVPLVGSATTLTSCEHGGTGNADWICKSDGSSYLSMVELPAALPAAKSSA
jgi:hypothetical protein